MDRWQRLRDPLATVIFGLLAIAVSVGALPDTVNRDLVLEVVAAGMTLAAGITTILQRGDTSKDAAQDGS
jgi:hypothetical protein